METKQFYTQSKISFHRVVANLYSKMLSCELKVKEHETELALSVHVKFVASR